MHFISDNGLVWLAEDLGLIDMGVHPKIGITGLPRSGKSAVMEKVLSMLVEERTKEIILRG